MNIFDDVDEVMRPIKKRAERASRDSAWLPYDHRPSDGEALVYVVILIVIAAYGLGTLLF